MSFSNAPDLDTLGRVAGSLGVDEAFVEKDWFVVQAIRILCAQATADIIPVFSGGTALLKAHQLIKRFSEDIDFKLSLSEAFLAKSANQQRRALSAFKKKVAAALEVAGFTKLKIEAGSGNAFIRIEMDYPSVLDADGPHAALRPHILAELSAKPPRRPTRFRPMASFIAQYRGPPPELDAIACVDPVETGADKLSAFAWRMLVRERGGAHDDPTIIRHVHDLAALEAVVARDAGFGALLEATLVADSDRGNGAVAHLPPRERLAAMMARLDEDAAYQDDYRRFVEGLAFAESGEVPDYAAAVAALRRLAAALP
jgi:hypothetical protein